MATLLTGTPPQVEDLEDVRGHMSVLKDVRERESEIDNVMIPIEEIYSLLGRYEVKVAKEETDMVGDLRYSWRKLRKLATDVSDNLSCLQVGSQYPITAPPIITAPPRLSYLPVL